jgi:hypothetical protein
VREEDAAVERPEGMSEHEHEDLEREETDVEAHSADVDAADDGDDDGNDFELHLFQRR